MSLRQRAILAGVMIFGALGDVALSRGMKNMGQISFDRLPDLIAAVFTPWVGAGIVLLLAFFISYLTALSFADLTYVLPATAIGYIIMALMAKFFLHEDISAQRWAGIALIALGVGFVTRGPAQTPTARGMRDSSRQDDGGPATTGAPQASRFCSSAQETSVCPRGAGFARLRNAPQAAGDNG